MKIAILVAGLPPLYAGGTEIATAQIAHYAALAGHEVHVIAADGLGKAGESYRALQNGFKVHRVETMSVRYLHGLFYIPQAAVTVLALRPDLVHVQSLYMMPTALITRPVVPYLFFERGGVGESFPGREQAYRTAMRFAQRVIAQTNNQAHQLASLFPRPVEVIPNGVDVERFGKISKQEAREQLGLTGKRKVILSVGRARKEKNLGLFIDCALLDKLNTYVLVGDGPEIERLKLRACGRVLFAGHVDNKTVPVYMAAADLLVNTSTYEGFPVAVLEGMAAGLPVVAPRVSGLPEIVADGVNGILTEPGSAQSTLDAILTIIENPGTAQRMGESNKEKAKEYTWQSVVKKLYG